MSVLLKKPIFEGISQKELVQQIESKKKCKEKLPTWFETQKIYYPKKVHIEQTSSEIAAAYKSEIVDGKSLLDLTGGLGIDSYYFSKKIDSVFHFEVDEKLHEIASYNFSVLNAKNIRTFLKDGLKFLEDSKKEFDWLYLDPSRRNETKGKVFQLTDCEPNIIENLGMLCSKSENILLKTSPLLDISIGLSALQNVKEIHVLAVNNEVKEVLWVLKKGLQSEIKIKTWNHQKSGAQTFNYLLSNEKSTISIFSQPLSYLYEPNAAILKSGAFKSIGVAYEVKKLHPNTHLYTSKALLNFPGRRFRVMKVVNFNSKGMRELNIKKANITTRNFSVNVATIRKKYSIRDGGESFLFFFKNIDNEHVVALCNKV